MPARFARPMAASIFGRVVIALQQPQLLGPKRLAAEAQPRDAERGQRIDHCRVDVGRIRFDGPFIAGRERMPAHNQTCQAPKLLGRQMRRRAAAKVERVDLVRLA